jgi:hypothetical protein
MAGNYVADKVAEGANAAAESASGIFKAGARAVATGAKAFRSPYTTVAVAPFAIKELFAKCECEKK